MMEARVVSDSGVAWFALTQREFAAWVDSMRADDSVTEITVYDKGELVYDAWRWTAGWESDFRPPADWGAIDILPPQGSS